MKYFLFVYPLWIESIRNGLYDIAFKVYLSVFSLEGFLLIISRLVLLDRISRGWSYLRQTIQSRDPLGPMRKVATHINFRLISSAKPSPVRDGLKLRVAQIRCHGRAFKFQSYPKGALLPDGLAGVFDRKAIPKC